MNQYQVKIINQRYELIKAMNTIVSYMNDSNGKNPFSWIEQDNEDDMFTVATDNERMEDTCVQFVNAIKQHGKFGFYIWNDTRAFGDVSDTNEETLREAVKHVNNVYGKLNEAIDKNLDVEADIQSDMYEILIKVYAEKFGFSENHFEDFCTNVRYFGWDND